MAKMRIAATVETTAEVRTELYATYIQVEDITVVWQHMYVGGEFIQRLIVGWYCGEPNERDTEQFSHLGILGQYIWD